LDKNSFESKPKYWAGEAKTTNYFHSSALPKSHAEKNFGVISITA
jgi:hypothetical protein